MRLYGKNNYLICEPYEFTNETSNSLIIQNINTNKMAKIVDAGDAYPVCGFDNIILYNEDKAKEYMLNGTKYIVIHSDDIYAVVREEE